MKKFINLISDDKKKYIFLFIFLNILLVLFETFSIALIPLIIDIVISENPLLPQYLNSINNLISNIDKKDLLLYSSIFVVFSFFNKKFIHFGTGIFSRNFIGTIQIRFKEKNFLIYMLQHLLR